MRKHYLRAAAMLAGIGLGIGGAQAQPSGEITIWSWNIAASSLQATVAGFNKLYPDVTVTVEDLGNQQVFDKSLAGCAAGGEGLPDIVSIENFEAEIYWNQFPDCFVDLKTLGYTDEIASGFPDFKRTELEVGEVAYAMPWDSGPVACSTAGISTRRRASIRKPSRRGMTSSPPARRFRKPTRASP